MGNVTGAVTRSTNSRECFNWTIPGFLVLPRFYGTSIESDFFPVADTKWVLALYWKFDGVELELRRDFGPVVPPFPVRVGIVGTGGRQLMSRWGATDCNGKFVASAFLPMEAIEKRGEEIAPKGTITVFCEMRGGVVTEASTQTAAAICEAGTSTQTGKCAQVRVSVQTETTNQTETATRTEASIQTETTYQARSSTQTETTYQAGSPTQARQINNEKTSLRGTSSQVKAPTATKPSSDIQDLQLDFENLLQSEEGSDVCLKVSGREFRVHRFILGARSPVFSCMFRHDMAEKFTGVVDIDDLEPDSFESFLQYVYAGRVKLSEENVYNLYQAADKYDVRGLKSVCIEYMKRTLSVDTFCDVITLALRHREEELLQQTFDFLPKNLEKIIVSVNWQVFFKQHPMEANELLIKALVPGNEKNSS